MTWRELKAVNLMSRPFSDFLETVAGVSIKDLYPDEFNKDDLLILLKCVRLCEIDHGECSDLDNVKSKLQSMIDTYCKHQPIWETPNHVICYCQVCKKVLEK